MINKRNDSSISSYRSDPSYLLISSAKRSSTVLVGHPSVLASSQSWTWHGHFIISYLKVLREPCGLACSITIVCYVIKVPLYSSRVISNHGDRKLSATSASVGWLPVSSSFNLAIIRVSSSQNPSVTARTPASYLIRFFFRPPRTIRFSHPISFVYALFDFHPPFG